MVKMLVIVLVIVLGVVIITLLALRNDKDRKTLNPDAPDAVEETETDLERKKDEG